MATTLRYGLIGISQGYYARVYSQAAARTKGVEVIGLCDLGRPEEYVRDCLGTDAAAFAAEIGAPLFHRLEDLLALAPDIVFIASEPCEHVAHALAALDAGAHVLVAKPISLAAEEIDRLATAAQKTGRVVLPGQPARYEEGMIRAAAEIRRGAIGRPLVVRLLVNHEAMLAPAWERETPRSGGPLGTFGIYCFDLVRWLTGLEFTEVFAYGDNFTLRGQIEEADNILITGRLTGGTMASICLTSSVRWNYPFLDLEVIGERRTLRVNYHNYTVITQGAEGACFGPVRYSPMNQNELAHFLEVVRGLAEPHLTLEDAKRALLLIEATRASIARHAPVKLETTKDDGGKGHEDL
ncbi:MAG: Gfo/Idh/MocA family protein [Bacillota bacterium]